MAYFNNVDMSMEFFNRVFEYFPRWNFVGPCNVQVNVKFDNHLLTRGVKLLLQNTYLRKNNMQMGHLKIDLKKVSSLRFRDL